MGKNKILNIILVCFLTSVIIYNNSAAQQHGKVEHPDLGLSVTIPDGWVGQKTDNGFLLGSYTEPGFILLYSHEYGTPEQLISEINVGLQEANGTSMTLAGNIEKLSNQSIGAELRGTVEWQQAKSYFIGIINPHGTDISILATVATHQYSVNLRETALNISRSVKFVKVDKTETIAQWKKLLTNARLTYMESYNSSGSGGYTSNQIIDLCAAGTFNYNQQSNLSVDTGGASGYSGDSAKGSGRWAIVTNMQNQPVLQLTFYNSEVYEYILATEGEKTLLNGHRYYRTYKGQYAPQCF